MLIMSSYSGGRSMSDFHFLFSLISKYIAISHIFPLIEYFFKKKVMIKTQWKQDPLLGSICT